MRAVTRSLRLIDSNVRNDREANRLFIETLSSENNAEMALRRMNEAGVLGRFVPDFGKIVAMMQFNMYHHYTVDEHLIRCIGILSDIEKGSLAKDHPLVASLLPTLKSERKLIYIPCSSTILPRAGRRSFCRRGSDCPQAGAALRIDQP